MKNTWFDKAVTPLINILQESNKPIINPTVWRTMATKKKGCWHFQATSGNILQMMLSMHRALIVSNFIQNVNRVTSMLVDFPNRRPESEGSLTEEQQEEVAKIMKDDNYKQQWPAFTSQPQGTTVQQQSSSSASARGDPSPQPPVGGIESNWDEETKVAMQSTRAKYPHTIVNGMYMITKPYTFCTVTGKRTSPVCIEYTWPPNEGEFLWHIPPTHSCWTNLTRDTSRSSKNIWQTISLCSSSKCSP